MKVFISRYLKSDSPFAHVLSAQGHIVHGESLIHFNAVSFGVLPEADWLFFYSKSGVRYFLQQVRQEYLLGKRLAVIGAGTASYLEKVYRAPDFVGDGDPISAAAAFLSEARGRTVLFLRAKESRQSIQQLLGDKIVQKDLVVYENQPRSDFDLEYHDKLVFTSPLNAEAYYSKYPVLKKQSVIAIGDTTRQKLIELGVCEIEVADTPSEEALAKSVLGIL